MKRLDDIVELVSGSPQFRIEESFDEKAPLYMFYGQPDIEDDLVGIGSNRGDSKQVRTFDKVNTLCQGDVVFSLISGKSSLVSANHQGYLYTQNYVKLSNADTLESDWQMQKELTAPALLMQWLRILLILLIGTITKLN